MGTEEQKSQQLKLEQRYSWDWPALLLFPVNTQSFGGLQRDPTAVRSRFSPSTQVRAPAEVGTGRGSALERPAEGGSAGPLPAGQKLPRGGGVPTAPRERAAPAAPGQSGR